MMNILYMHCHHLGYYYNLLKDILRDNTDKYLEEQRKTLDVKDDYGEFRKEIFFDRLNKLPFLFQCLIP